MSRVRTGRTIIGVVVGVWALVFVGGGAGFAAAKPVAAPADDFPKMETFNASKYKGETGTIKLPIAGEASLLLQKAENGRVGDYLMVDSKGDSITVPVGRYELGSLSLTVKSKSGTAWTISDDDSKGGPQTLEIKAGESISVLAESPLISAMKSGETGKIKMPTAGDYELGLCRIDDGKPGDSLQVESKGDIVEVPAGDYQLTDCFLAVTPKRGTKWTTSYRPEAGNQPPSLRIDPGGSVKLPVDLPYTSAIKARKFGTVVLPYAGRSVVRLTAVAKNPTSTGLTVSGNGGTTLAPSGVYKVERYTTTFADKRGREWMLAVLPAPKQKARIIHVNPGSRVRLGSPGTITASIEAKQTGKGKASFALNLRARNGCRCVVLCFDSSGGHQGFKVLSESGKLLMSGKLAYG